MTSISRGETSTRMSASQPERLVGARIVGAHGDEGRLLAEDGIGHRDAVRAEVQTGDRVTGVGDRHRPDLHAVSGRDGVTPAAGTGAVVTGRRSDRAED